MSEYIQIDTEADPEFEALWEAFADQPDLFPQSAPYLASRPAPPTYIPTPIIILEERRRLQSTSPASATETSRDCEKGTAASPMTSHSGTFRSTSQHPGLIEEIPYSTLRIHSDYTWIKSQDFYHIKVPCKSIRKFRQFRKNVVCGSIQLKWDSDLNLRKSQFRPDQPLFLVPGQPLPDPRRGPRRHHYEQDPSQNQQPPRKRRKESSLH